MPQSSSEEDDVQTSICISGRCGLCGFHLEDGDSVLAVRQDKPISEPLICTYPYVSSSDGALTYYFLPDMHDDSDALISYAERAAACHIGCMKVLESTDFRDRVQQAVSCSYQPSRREDLERQKLLQWNLANRLKWCYPLPIEMRLLIAQHCVREYVVVSLYQFTSIFNPPSTFEVDLDKDVWVHMIDFLGEKYIHSISNRQKAPSRLFHGKRASKKSSIDAIYVAEDAYGVREVILGTSDKPPKSRRRLGIWWKTIQLTHGNVLICQTDGSKLRSLESTSHCALTPVAACLWETPQLPAACYRWYQLRKSQGTLRMASLTLNDPRCTGYSMLRTSGNIIYIHAHISETDEDLSFYDIGNGLGSIAWLYFPINPGERVVGMWARLRKVIPDTAMIFQTNKSRTCVMGGHQEPHHRYRGSLIHQPPPARSLLYFSTGSHPFSQVAVQSHAPMSKPQVRPQLRLPVPISPFPARAPGEDILYTFAELDGVSKVTPCLSDIRGEYVIIGLLLHYFDGNRCAVGQVRLDCLTDALKVQDVDTFWLGFPHMIPNATSISLSRPADDKTYLKVALKGRLEWWYSHWQCRVCYEGQASPPTKIARQSLW